MPRRKWFDDDAEKQPVVPQPSSEPVAVNQEPVDPKEALKRDRKVLMAMAAKAGREKQEREERGQDWNNGRKPRVSDFAHHQMSDAERTKLAVDPYGGSEDFGDKLQLVKSPWAGTACREMWDRYMLCVQKSVEPRTQCENLRLDVVECRLRYHDMFEPDGVAGFIKPWMQFNPLTWSAPDYHDRFEYFHHSRFKTN